jgi:uncharacterized repeat protein (TIGR03803 family)
MTQGFSLRHFVMYPLRALLALLAVITFMLLLPATDSQAQSSFSVLDSFCDQITCKSGEFPTSLTQATNGDLYGTTVAGGSNRNVLCSSVDATRGCGTIFAITAGGKLATLYSFCSEPNCTDGALPAAGLIQATNGDLYGTTGYGGTNNAGTVFKITPVGKLTTLYSFCSLANCADGRLPVGALVQANNGDIYGTTSGSKISSNNTCTAPGAGACGTVFKITPSGTLTILYRFCMLANCADGSFPEAGLIQATNGDLYGTTAEGGADPSGDCVIVGGCGTVFKITPSGTLTTLYNFCSQPSCTDGQFPAAPVMQAANGDLYGTTVGGGGTSVDGTVFQISVGGTLTTLHTFCSVDYEGYCADGGYPYGALIQATDGNFYGTTSLFGVSEFGEGAAGTAFELTPAGVLTVLHTFCGTNETCADGEYPKNALLQATNGDLYGTTEEGGPGAYAGGAIFMLSVGLGPFVALQTTSGQVSAKVTLLGTDLTGATSVTFNGTPATFTVNAIGSAITATVPIGATTGTVQVVTPNGALQSNVAYRVKP